MSATSCLICDPAPGFTVMVTKSFEIIRNYSKTFTTSEDSLIYNFVMEKSWQSSNSSRLMRNVRRSVHQVFFQNFIFRENYQNFENFVLKFLKNRIISGEMWRSLNEKNYSKFEFIDHYDKHLLLCFLLPLSQLFSGIQSVVIGIYNDIDDIISLHFGKELFFSGSVHRLRRSNFDRLSL